MRLEGKVAIVSGGGTGIGAATARVFASEGAKVVVTGRRAEPLEAVAAEIDGRAVAGDTSDDDHAGRPSPRRGTRSEGSTSSSRTRDWGSAAPPRTSTTNAGSRRST